MAGVGASAAPSRRGDDLHYRWGLDPSHPILFPQDQAQVAAPHIIFAGGGSLCQLYPGLAVAEISRQKVSGLLVTFTGSGRAIERKVVRDAGHRYVALPCRPSPQGPLESLRFLTDNVAGYWASRWMLKEQHASLVVGLGGYASAGLVRACAGPGHSLCADRTKRPSFANEPLARAASPSGVRGVGLCSGALRPRTNFQVTGLPGRQAFEDLYNLRRRGVMRRDASLYTEQRLVVLSDENDDQTLNNYLPEVFRQLSADLAGWRIVHQTGERQLAAVQDQYAAANLDVLTVAYADRLEAVLDETELVIGRPTGGSLTELCLSRTPAVLVPDTGPNFAQHRANAEIFRNAGGCTVVERTTPEQFVRQMALEVRTLLHDQWRRQSMADAMLRLATPDANDRVAAICTEYLSGKTIRRAA